METENDMALNANTFQSQGHVKSVRNFFQIPGSSKNWADLLDDLEGGGCQCIPFNCPPHTDNSLSDQNHFRRNARIRKKSEEKTNKNHRRPSTKIRI